MVKSTDPELQSQAAAVLRVLSVYDDNRVKAVESGALDHLVPLMDSQVEKVLINAVGAIKNITVNVDLGSQAVAAGALPPLVRLLDSDSVEVLRLAATTISNIVLSDEQGVCCSSWGSLSTGWFT
eukprot:Rmarinus@m.27184